MKLGTVFLNDHVQFNNGCFLKSSKVMRGKQNVPCYITSVVRLFPRIPLELFYMPGYLCYEDFLAYWVLNLSLGCYTDFIHDFFHCYRKKPRKNGGVNCLDY
jgi:hypothetical protein